MNSPSIPPAGADAASRGVAASPAAFPFAILFLVWLLVVVTATLVTFILPESYSSTARILIARDPADISGLTERQDNGGYDPYFIQTELEVMQSEIILARVVQDLDLNKEWGKKYANGERLKTSESVMLLQGRIDLRLVRNTRLLAIRVFSENPDEAARIANAVAAAYTDFRLNQHAQRISASIRALEEAYHENNVQIRATRAEMAELARAPGTPDTNRLDEASRRLEDLQRIGQMLFTKLATEKTDLNLPATGMVQVVDTAVAGLRPVRPNKPLNICIGIVVGGCGGLSLATLVYVLHRRESRRKSGIPRAPFSPPFRALVQFLIALVVGVVVGYQCATPYDPSAIIVIPLAFVVGGLLSAYIEIARPRPMIPSDGAPGTT